MIQLGIMINTTQSYQIWVQDIPLCLGRSEKWQRPVIWSRAHVASSKVESSNIILRAFWFCSYLTYRIEGFKERIPYRWYSSCSEVSLRPTSNICDPGLMPTVWAGVPCVTWCTKTPVLLPPITVSWLSSDSPWKEMLSRRPLTRIAFARERIRKGGAVDLERLMRQQTCYCMDHLFYENTKGLSLSSEINAQIIYNNKHLKVLYL